MQTASSPRCILFCFSRFISAVRLWINWERSSFVRIFKSLLLQNCLQTLLAAVHKIFDLLLTFRHNRCRVPVAHFLQVNQVYSFPVFRFQFIQCRIELPIPLLPKDFGLSQGFIWQFKIQVINPQKEVAVFFAMPQGKISGYFVKICLETALSRNRTLFANIWEKASIIRSSAS